MILINSMIYAFGNYILKFYTQSKSELTLFVYEAGLGDRMTESGRWHFVEL